MKKILFTLILPFFIFWCTNNWKIVWTKVNIDKSNIEIKSLTWYFEKYYYYKFESLKWIDELDWPWYDYNAINVKKYYTDSWLYKSLEIAEDTSKFDKTNISENILEFINNENNLVFQTNYNYYSDLIKWKINIKNEWDNLRKLMPFDENAIIDNVIYPDFISDNNKVIWISFFVNIYQDYPKSIYYVTIKYQNNKFYISIFDTWIRNWCLNKKVCLEKITFDDFIKDYKVPETTKKIINEANYILKSF